MAPGKRMRFVPPIVFASTVVAVTPSCGVAVRDNRVIVLAIAGFTGCPASDAGADAAQTGGSGGSSTPCGTGGSPAGSGGRMSTGGANATGGGIIVLAVMGFSGSGSQ
jgi:hypothetical protein